MTLHVKIVSSWPQVTLQIAGENWPALYNDLVAQLIVVNFAGRPQYQRKTERRMEPAGDGVEICIRRKGKI